MSQLSKKSPSGTRTICVFRSLTTLVFSDAIKIGMLFINIRALAPFVPIPRAPKKLYGVNSHLFSPLACLARCFKNSNDGSNN